MLLLPAAIVPQRAYADGERSETQLYLQSSAALSRWLYFGRRSIAAECAVAERIVERPRGIASERLEPRRHYYCCQSYC